MSELTLWSHGDTTRIGRGVKYRIDPGVGAGRYDRALESARDGGAELAFASFTFDPDEPGSVVIVPETVEILERFDLPEAELPKPMTIDTGREIWRAGFVRALQSLAQTEIEKVVLARQVDLLFERAVSGAAIASRMRPGSADYLFAMEGLVGASPELLASLEFGSVRSLALAGTAPSEDRLNDSRVEREHSLTAKAVETSLRDHLARDPDVKRSVVDLGKIKHLGTLIQGEALPGTTVLSLVRALHPTPAVGGVPTGAALELIKEIEPRSRGRYAGPIGWFDGNGDGEFCLALRCGLVDQNKLTLYAGGGLVTGADIEYELAETDLKLRPMLEALGVC